MPAEQCIGRRIGTTPETSSGKHGQLEPRWRFIIRAALTRASQKMIPHKPQNISPALGQIGVQSEKTLGEWNGKRSNNDCCIRCTELGVLAAGKTKLTRYYEGTTLLLELDVQNAPAAWRCGDAEECEAFHDRQTCHAADLETQPRSDLKSTTSYYVGSSGYLDTASLSGFFLIIAEPVRKWAPRATLKVAQAAAVQCAANWPSPIIPS